MARRESRARRRRARPAARDFLFQCAPLSVREPRDPGRDRCPPPLPGAFGGAPVRGMLQIIVVLGVSGDIPAVPLIGDDASGHRAGHHLHGLGMLSISARDRQGGAFAHQHPVPRPQRCVIQWRIKGVVESHQHLGHWLAGLPKALATSLALVYARTGMGNDMTQPSRRLALALPDYPTTRLPRAASLSANPAAADRSALVLTAAPSIRVAHTRRAAVPHTADHVCRRRHQSTPAGAAGSKKQTSYVRPPPRVACARERRHGIED